MAQNANVTFYRSPVELRDAAMAIPDATLAHFRDVFIETLRAKIATLKTGDASAVRGVMNAAMKGHHDAALRVMLAGGLPANFYERKMRDGTQTMNAKAIPKAVAIAPQLLTVSPIWGGSAMQTIRGTIMGLLDGAHNNPRTSLAVYLNDYMSARGFGTIPGQYNSGGTQSSSSAHALASLGLLKIDAVGAYEIAERGVLEMLAGKEGNAEDAASVADAATLAALQA
jgi:hypothetical protein